MSAARITTWRCLKSGACSLELTGIPQEERRVALALTGWGELVFWNGGECEARFDVFDLKGFVEEFLEQFGVRGVTFGKRAESTAMFLESATIALGGKLPLGELGQLSPALAKKYDLRDAVFLAELNLDQLLARRNPAKSFKPLPQFPSIRRDVAMLVPEATTHEAVLQTVKKTKPANLETVELFDVFPRQEFAGRAKKSGIRIHLSLAGQNFDRCRSECGARENRGGAEAESWRNGSGMNFLKMSACARWKFHFNC